MINCLVGVAVLVTAGMPEAAPSAPRNDSIRQQDMKADLFFLAGDAFRGRLTGTAENNLAAQFIASRFQRLGLKPVGADGTYFQPFHLATATLGPGNRLEVSCPGVTPRFQLGPDFFPLYFSPSGRAKGWLAFAGYGISAPELGHVDYRVLNVRDRIVLVLDHEPGENDPDSPFDGVVMSEAATPLRKALLAQEKGAIGILFVADVQNHPESQNFEAMTRAAWPEKPPRIARYSLQDWVERVHIPAAQVSIAAARALFRGEKSTFDEAARAAERPGPASAFFLDRDEVTISTDIVQHVVPDRNVVAAVEGSDPARKDEWVVVSCHHDHDGTDGDRVYSGADDNGSGTVGMLEIAEAYALAGQEGHRPKRSILFASFNSEERGLLGSWAFVERPLVPLDKIVAVLNMDMVGRDEEVPEGGGPRFRGLPAQSAQSNANAVNILGHSRSPSLARTIEAANAAFGLTLKKVLDNNKSNLLRRSDQWPFLQKHVPAIFFHTGLHPDYHTVQDRPERVNYAKMERIVRLVHQVSWGLAQRTDRPRFEPRSTDTKPR
jgi:Zn-dependent M28 family amino/carboxypeptidase